MVRRVECDLQQRDFRRTELALNDKVRSFEIHAIAVIDVQAEREERICQRSRSGRLNDLHVRVTACKVERIRRLDAVVMRTVDVLFQWPNAELSCLLQRD